MMHTRSVQREQSVNMSSASEQRSGWSAPAGLLTALAIGLLALPGMGARYWLQGELDALYCLFSLFFSINLLICYWEMCLFFRRDQIPTRAEYWRRRGNDSGRSPALEFLLSRVTLRRSLSPTVWADVWAAYSRFDSAYVNRHTYGFNADVANGFATPASTLVLYIAFTGGVMPAIAAGIVGAMLCWQWIYMSSLYLVIAFTGRKRNPITTRELYVYLIGPNILWVLIPIVGLYVSIRLILDGDYSVIGMP